MEGDNKMDTETEQLKATIKEVVQVVKKPEARGRPPTCLKCGWFHQAVKPCKEPIKQDMIDKAKARLVKFEERQKPAEPANKTTEG